MLFLGRFPVVVGCALGLLACRAAGAPRDPVEQSTDDDGGGTEGDEAVNDDEGEDGDEPMGGRGGTDPGEAGRGGGGGTGGRPPTSADAGSGDAAAKADAAAARDTAPATEAGAAVTGKDAGPSNLVPVVAAYGYGALRAFSYDGGKTWPLRTINDPRGGDDDNLIRGMAFANGTWIAAGWKIFISRDGARTWSEISADRVPGGWYDCVNYKDGKWIVKVIRPDYGGQNGDVISSSDNGATWRDDAQSITCNPVAPDGAVASRPSGTFGVTKGMAVPPATP